MEVEKKVISFVSVQLTKIRLAGRYIMAMRVAMRVVCESRDED